MSIPQCLLCVDTCRNILCFPIKNNTEGSDFSAFTTFTVFLQTLCIYKHMHMCLCGCAYTAWRVWIPDDIVPFLWLCVMLISDVVGVAELCNKVGGKCVNPTCEKCVRTYMYMTLYAGKFFTKYDQEIAATFSAYCGISLYHVRYSYMPGGSFLDSQCCKSHIRTTYM